MGRKLENKNIKLDLPGYQDSMHKFPIQVNNFRKAVNALNPLLSTKHRKAQSISIGNKVQSAKNIDLYQGNHKYLSNAFGNYKQFNTNANEIRKQPETNLIKNKNLVKKKRQQSEIDINQYKRQQSEIDINQYIIAKNKNIEQINFKSKYDSESKQKKLFNQDKSQEKYKTIIKKCQSAEKINTQQKLKNKRSVLLPESNHEKKIEKININDQLKKSQYNFLKIRPTKDKIKNQYTKKFKKYIQLLSNKQSSSNDQIKTQRCEKQQLDQKVQKLIVQSIKEVTQQKLIKQNEVKILQTQMILKKQINDIKNNEIRQNNRKKFIKVKSSVQIQQQPNQKSLNTNQQEGMQFIKKIVTNKQNKLQTNKSNKNVSSYNNLNKNIKKFLKKQSKSKDKQQQIDNNKQLITKLIQNKKSRKNQLSINSNSNIQLKQQESKFKKKLIQLQDCNITQPKQNQEEELVKAENLEI